MKNIKNSIGFLGAFFSLGACAAEQNFKDMEEMVKVGALECRATTMIEKISPTSIRKKLRLDVMLDSRAMRIGEATTLCVVTEDDKIGFLQNLNIANSAINRGVSTYLLKDAQDFLLENKCTSMRLLDDTHGRPWHSIDSDESANCLDQSNARPKAPEALSLLEEYEAIRKWNERRVQELTRLYVDNKLVDRETKTKYLQLPLPTEKQKEKQEKERPEKEKREMERDFRAYVTNYNKEETSYWQGLRDARCQGLSNSHQSAIEKALTSGWNTKRFGTAGVSLVALAIVGTCAKLMTPVA